MLNRRGLEILFIALSFSCPSFTMTVTLEPSAPSPSPVGARITWSTTVDTAETGPLWYRYRVKSPLSNNFVTVKDYSSNASFEWAPSQHDGVYEIEVTVRNRDTGDTASTITPFEAASNLDGGNPAINPTANELVYLYSMPPCAAGSQAFIAFARKDGPPQTTHWRPCAEGRTLNFYLAGLRADTEYVAQQTVIGPDGANSKGPTLGFRTGALSFAPAATRTLNSDGARGQGILLQTRLFEFSIATDAEDNVVWYYARNSPYLVRPQPGGYFLVLVEDSFGSDEQQLLQVIDLAGNIVQETNAARVNEQLQAMGQQPMTSFHHDAQRLPDGRILALAGAERLMRGVQGEGEVDIIGDKIILLSPELEVLWAWDAFDHMDVRRAALFDEKCTVGSGGCPVFRLAEIANDWLHGNSIAVTPDGGIVYSARHQDWIVKIDFANGTGSGAVIWRLGKDGDFRMLSDVPAPWFSHQHDAAYIDPAGTKLLLFDNGNTRYAEDESATSRGQLLEIDETNRTVKLALNADLGAYAFALGSAQYLPNGNFLFGLGWRPDTYSEALEFDASGRLVVRTESATQQYRSVRMSDLYTP